MTETRDIQIKNTQIREIQWKNLRGIQLENQLLSVVVLPSLGGKLASVYHKERKFELAAQYRGESYRIPQFGADFSQYDASGLDDAFPNIVGAELELDGKKHYYPDHGEIWSSPFHVEYLPEGVGLSYESEIFGYTYEKKIFLSGDRICLEYDIQNKRTEPLPCIWTFHGLVRYEEDMELLYGEDVRAFRNVFESRELGEVDRIYKRENDIYNFERVPHMESETMVKYYAEGRRQKGFCGYRYPSAGLECRYHYDAEIIPYLGVWITAGGYRGDYNCALEPANGYYDDIRIARENKSLYYLKREKPLRFGMALEVCRI
ncbi:MAG: DUF5107 domain-containing protein [Eubacteriales bacterium]|nr:DUF5107 domain-containing protein [Eubacteriales bacterium]